MSETEQLIAQKEHDHENISIRAYVLDDSLKELLILTNDFPEVSSKFAASPNYRAFINASSEDFKNIPQSNFLPLLRGDVQTLVEEYLLKKNQATEQNIFFGYLSSIISLVGVVLFFILLYAIYLRYQRNSDRLEQVTKSLEQERLTSIQSSKLASLGEMAAGLAHEINNPLAVIIGRAEMIMGQISAGTATDIEVTKTISKINDMAVRISKIVTSMRKISKGSSQDELVSTNLSSVIDDILNLSSERIRSSSINLDISGVNPELFVKANFTHLSQVIINLLNNSIDELGKIPEDKRNIWLSTEVQGEQAMLKIKDSGPGIPAAVREKLFQPFFTTKEIGKGTGLGLSISKGLMQDMEGDLELDPDLSQTCFILKFKKA
jgi:C4-dicarboxylate-specific signal transduction histidine kinase